MVHTDMADYPTVLAEAFRVLASGGIFVHVGVHPCFCGGFVDRSDLDAIVIRPGYLDGAWTTDSWTDRGVRDKVGAVHYPLADLLNAVTAIDFVLEEFAEGAEPTPVALALRAANPDRFTRRFRKASRGSCGVTIWAAVRPRLLASAPGSVRSFSVVSRQSRPSAFTQRRWCLAAVVGYSGHGEMP